MKGLFVLLAVVAVASAGVPVRAEKGIIEDILAVKECLENVITSVEGTIGEVIAAVQNLQNIVQGSINDLKACTGLGDPMQIAQCIMNVGNALQSQIGEAILGIQQSISGLLSVPDDVIACIKIIGN